MSAEVTHTKPALTASTPPRCRHPGGIHHQFDLPSANVAARLVCLYFSRGKGDFSEDPP